MFEKESPLLVPIDNDSFTPVYELLLITQSQIDCGRLVIKNSLSLIVDDVVLVNNKYKILPFYIDRSDLE